MLHGGDIRTLAEQAGLATDELLDCSASINPCGPPLWLRDVVARALDGVLHYPDPQCRALRAAAAARFGCRAGQVLPGAGTEALIDLLPRALGTTRMLLPIPCYNGYHEAARRNGCEILTVTGAAEQGFRVDCARLGSALRDGDLVICGHPANPGGQLLPVDELLPLMRAHRAVTFVIDEAFIELCDRAASLIGCTLPNVLVLRSLTKCFAIPGMRVGLAVGPEELVTPLADAQSSWSVGCVEEAVAVACLGDDEHLRQSRERLRVWRDGLAAGLAVLPGCQVLPGAANYHLLRLPPGTDAATVCAAALRSAVALRDGSGIAGLGPGWLRIAVRSDDENERCLGALRRVLGGAPAIRRPRRTPALMLQGCSSDAGKSLMATAFCRILLQDGCDVAPFKAQNMANNAGVTRDGLEIGRAQMLQAQACRLDADVRMNPVLLKPTGECGSQVVLMGQAHGSMDVQAYHRFTEAARATALAAYDSLAAEHQVLVLEGAGSPGEVNLRGRDFVNMPMAQHAGAAVLLVGDIDRGGVYASLAGHCETFTPAERRLLAGFLINKFRGDETLLTPAHDWLERRTGVPVLGCVRHLGRHGLPEEDSLGLGSGWRSDATAELHITVVALPRLANASDCDPLAAEPDVALHLAARPEDLAGADCILLPGSKASLLDADWLQETGMAAAIRAAHGSGVLVIGICGGLQLLGRELTDPQAVESDGRPRAGLGLQPWCTAMAGAKIRRCTGARHRDGAILRGYEIHHGRTDWRGAAPLITADDGSVIGAGDEHCWGCYLHGCFDADAFRHAFLDDLRRRRGLPRLDGRPHVDLEPAIDALAAQVRASVDLAAIYERMGISTRRRARPSQTDDR